MSRFEKSRTDQQGNDERREEMVCRTIADRGVRDPRVLAAMRTVQRERFIDPSLEDSAYQDSPLPIEKGQTISQPFIVALMAEQARIGPSDRVLEVGTGSGYGAAVLGCIAAEVWTIERHPELVAESARTLRDEGFDNVHVVEGDGTLGWPDAAPFDAIVVTAGAPGAPDALCGQLVDGGRLIIPVGQSRRSQELVRITRRGDSFETEELAAVRFVPLVGDEGW